MHDLDQTHAWFGRVETRYLHLTALAAAATFGHPPFNPLSGSLEGVDRALFRLWPKATRWAWVVVLSLSAPIADPGADRSPSRPG